MKLTDHTALIQKILANHADQALVSEGLATLSEDYTAVMAENETAKTTAERAELEKEALRKANMQLFLKIGEPKKEETTTATEDKTPKFEDLFDDKGNLK